VTLLLLLAASALATAAPRLAAAPLPADRYPDLSERVVVTVLVFGDSGVGRGFTPVAEAAAAACFGDREAPCDLALLLGDNVYEEGMSAPGDAAWEEAFALPMAPFVERARSDFRFRAWVVAGNHDWGHDVAERGQSRVVASMDTTESAANLEIGSLWQHPALAYEVPGLPPWLHLHGADTEWWLSGARGTAVLDVTRVAMRATRGWDVVFAHHPPVSTGLHGASAKETDDERWARALTRLRRHGLSLVLAGHDHHQEVLETGGVPVLIQGNSSKGRDAGTGPYAPCSRWHRAGREARGFTILTFRPERVDVEMFDGAGAVVYTTTLPRVPSGQRGALGSCAP
jgi:hypothetical protein